ncbi:polyprenyl synthetase family protein [Parapedobacter lycopersici]|uniref:polyprenyl synthetase family protein n=1 Tax=Parapedobacter lycopersici TaxID=1864939 RepID=UPI00214D336B|nr:polyprenyl synthetase family protein [Parapedobacter lycopersici]
MQQTVELQQRIAEALSSIHIPEKPENLYDPIRYMLQIGGKRIRPLLTLMAADLFSISDSNRAVPAALAIELFHNFSLVHDDIMDAAPLRRGKPTIHQKWDSSVAILSGDRLLIMAYDQLARCGGDRLAALVSTFNAMATAVCEGQQLDMDFERREQVGLAEYIHMITLKTSVLLGAALKMGAIVSHATETDARLIYEFGIHLGIAFQLQDDLLDVYGNPRQFGKKPGGDILANKKTYLLVTAFETADAETRAELTNLFTAKDSVPENKIDAVKAIYDRLQIQQLAEDSKQNYISKAFNALDSITVDEARKTPLRTLAQNLLHREA